MFFDTHRGPMSIRGIDIAGESIEVLESPSDFLRMLCEIYSASRRRIGLSCLYVGCGTYEEKVLSSIRTAKVRNPQLDLAVLLDFNRALRQETPKNNEQKNKESKNNKPEKNEPKNNEPEKNESKNDEPEKNEPTKNAHKYFISTDFHDPAKSFFFTPLRECSVSKLVPFLRPNGVDPIGRDPKFGAAQFRRSNVGLFYNPLLSGNWMRRYLYSLLPTRVREVVGVMHMKVYLGDDVVILGGANICTTYLTNRQDRYIVIRDSFLCDVLFRLIQLVSSLSYTLQLDPLSTPTKETINIQNTPHINTTQKNNPHINTREANTTHTNFTQKTTPHEILNNPQNNPQNILHEYDLKITANGNYVHNNSNYFQNEPHNIPINIPYDIIRKNYRQNNQQNIPQNCPPNSPKISTQNIEENSANINTKNIEENFANIDTENSAKIGRENIEENSANINTGNTEENFAKINRENIENFANINTENSRKINGENIEGASLLVSLRPPDLDPHTHTKEFVQLLRRNLLGFCEEVNCEVAERARERGKGGCKEREEKMEEGNMGEMKKCSEKMLKNPPTQTTVSLYLDAGFCGINSFSEYFIKVIEYCTHINLSMVMASPYFNPPPPFTLAFKNYIHQSCLFHTSDSRPEFEADFLHKSSQPLFRHKFEENHTNHKNHSKDNKNNAEIRPNLQTKNPTHNLQTKNPTQNLQTKNPAQKMDENMEKITEKVGKLEGYGKRVTFVTSASSANSFYGSKGVSNLVPELYNCASDMFACTIFGSNESVLEYLKLCLVRNFGSLKEKCIVLLGLMKISVLGGDRMCENARKIGREIGRKPLKNVEEREEKYLKNKALPKYEPTPTNWAEINTEKTKNRLFSKKKNIFFNRQCEILEYQKKGWSFHSKGVWIYGRDKKNEIFLTQPFLTIFGSSNFNQRSQLRDLELAFSLYTEDPKLRRKLGQEVTHLLPSLTHIQPQTRGNPPFSAISAFNKSVRTFLLSLLYNRARTFM